MTLGIKIILQTVRKMHLHFDVGHAAFIVLVWILAKNVLPMMFAWAKELHIPGADTAGKLVS